MRTAEEWNWEHTKICANDPAVHGQLLPTPQMVRFLKSVQADALRAAAERCRKHDGLSIMAAGWIDREAEALEEASAPNEKVSDDAS